MTAPTFPYILDAAADDATNRSAEELAILLRRAALRLRNTVDLPVDREQDDAIAAAGADHGLGRRDMIRKIVEDWLIGNGYLPAADLEEDSETAGRG